MFALAVSPSARATTPLLNSRGVKNPSSSNSFPPGEAREDWAILRALSGALGKPLPYNDIDMLRRAIVADAPHLAQRDSLPPSAGADPAVWEKIGVEGAINDRLPLQSRVDDYYLTNPVARASTTMASAGVPEMLRRWIGP